jgi:hypothetical protein
VTRKQEENIVKKENTTTQIRDLATDFLQIHTLITTALDNAVRHVREYEKTGFQSTKERDGFTMFARCLVTLLHAHHYGEDTIFVPYVKKHLPDLATSFVDEQHKEVDTELDRLIVRLDVMARETTLNRSLGKIVPVRATLDKLNTLWLAHKDEEEHFIIEQAAPRIPRADQEMLMAELLKHGMGASKPMSVMGAFLLYNFEPEMRNEFFSDAPWHLKDLLVPYIWKPKWGKMKPYLAYPPS